jgi:hypothetical protein
MNEDEVSLPFQGIEHIMRLRDKVDDDMLTVLSHLFD